MSEDFKGMTLGEYVIEKRVGQGGMGAVYCARHQSLDRVVAIKVLLPQYNSDQEFVSRFIREAKAAATLDHPNIIRIHDAGECEGLHYYVMEYVEGSNLRDILAEKRFFDEPEALRLARQAATGLAYAHSKNVVHRDIKPENLMLTREGLLKIADLGLAKNVGADSEQNLTETGTSMGTPFYMSPEQVKNAKSIDGRADIYSLGMTLYHLLAGRPPINHGTMGEIMAWHLSSEEIPPIKDLNPVVTQATEELVYNMCAKEIDKRYPTMALVHRDISRLLGETADEGSKTFYLPEVNFTPRQRKPPQKKGSPFFIIMATAIILVGITFWFFQVPGKSPENESAPPLAESPPSPGESAPSASPEKKSFWDIAKTPPPTPQDLLLAVERGDSPLVEKILAQKVDANFHNDRKKNPLMISAEKGHQGVTRALLKHGVPLNDQDEDGKTALMLAIEGGHSTILRMLLENGADAQIRDSKGESPLIRSIQKRNLESLKLLLDARIDPNSRDTEGRTALILAVVLGSEPMVAELLRHDVMVDEKDSGGHTALMLTPNPPVARLLLDKGANPQEKDRQGATAFFLSAFNQRTEMVKFFLSKGTSVDERDDNGYTALMHATVLAKNSTDTLQALLDKGADPNAKNNFGQSALIHAVLGGEGKNAAGIRLLIKNDAQVNFQDGTGTSPIMYAAALDHGEVVQALRNGNAEIHFFTAVAAGDILQVRDGLSRGFSLSKEFLEGIPHEELRGATLLFIAARNGHAEVVRLLLEKGANIQAGNQKGTTPYQIAKAKGRKEVMEILQNAGATE